MCGVCVWCCRCNWIHRTILEEIWILFGIYGAGCRFMQKTLICHWRTNWNGWEKNGYSKQWWFIQTGFFHLLFDLLSSIHQSVRRCQLGLSSMVVGTDGTACKTTTREKKTGISIKSNKIDNNWARRTNTNRRFCLSVNQPVWVCISHHHIHSSQMIGVIIIKLLNCLQFIWIYTIIMIILFIFIQMA